MSFVREERSVLEGIGRGQIGEGDFTTEDTEDTEFGGEVGIHRRVRPPSPLGGAATAGWR
jgi:hypothetical protein